MNININITDWSAFWLAASFFASSLMVALIWSDNQEEHRKWTDEHEEDKK